MSSLASPGSWLIFLYFILEICTTMTQKHFPGVTFWGIDGTKSNSDSGLIFKIKVGSFITLKALIDVFF